VARGGSITRPIVGVRNPGTPSIYTPICFAGWRHQFEHVPDFIVPERHGTIGGNVFRDDDSKGAFAPGMAPMPEVEITLDDRRRTRSAKDGSYLFTGVPRGEHRIVAIFSSRAPFFFTTASGQDAQENSTINFGIGFSLSGLLGQVMNDAGQGVADVTVAIRSRGLKWSATTDAAGKYFVSSLFAGEYDVQVDEDTLPAGYSPDTLEGPEHVNIGASMPGKSAFIIRAFRSIAGRVLNYDSHAGLYVPVIGAQVVLRESGLTALTDVNGRYLFRNLLAGSYAISVRNQVQTPARAVLLGGEPVDLRNVDFRVGSPLPPDASAPH
jgi:Carboxypeptidase regulatory-like domain